LENPPQKSAPLAGGVCQLTLVDAAAPAPNWFEAVTEYVVEPVFALEAWQVLPLELQPTQLNDVGDCVQFAVSVTDPPAYGVGLFALSVHTGGAVGGCCQKIDALAGEPTPDALLAVTL